MSRYCGHRGCDDGLSTHQCRSAIHGATTHRVECRKEDGYLDECISVVSQAWFRLRDSHKARS